MFSDAVDGLFSSEEEGEHMVENFLLCSFADPVQRGVMKGSRPDAKNMKVLQTLFKLICLVENAQLTRKDKLHRMFPQGTNEEVWIEEGQAGTAVEEEALHSGREGRQAGDKGVPKKKEIEERWKVVSCRGAGGADGSG